MLSMCRFKNEDYVKFSAMLMMEPPMTRVKGLAFKSRLTEEDIYRMRAKIRNEFDKIQEVLKQLDRCMLLIMRLVFRHAHKILFQSLLYSSRLILVDLLVFISTNSRFGS